MLSPAKEQARCFLLGGSGLLGRALTRRSRPGRTLTGTHHNNPADETIALDITGPYTIPPACDIVIVAIPLARIAMAAGTDVARRFCERVAHLSVVLLSTDAVFSGRAGNYDEAAAPDPLTGYGRSQALLDDMFLKTCRKGLVVRTSFLFGGRPPHLDKRLAPFLAGGGNTRDRRWPQNIYRSPTEADFCAEAIWQCIERGRTGIINVCGERLSIHEFFTRALARKAGFDVPPPCIETRPDVAPDTSLNPALMDATLGVKHTVGWQWYAETCKAMT